MGLHKAVGGGGHIPPTPHHHPNPRLSHPSPAGSWAEAGEPADLVPEVPDVPLEDVELVGREGLPDGDGRVPDRQLPIRLCHLRIQHPRAPRQRLAPAPDRPGPLLKGDNLFSINISQPFARKPSPPGPRPLFLEPVHKEGRP